MSRNRRILLAVALVAGAALVYFIWRRSPSPSLTGPMSTGDATDQFPATDPGSGGAGAGGSAPPDTSAQDILSTLAGENQLLLSQLLGSAQGLPSLLGNPYGFGINPPTAEQPVPEPTPAPAPAPAPTPASRGTSTPAAASPFAGFTATTVPGGTVYTPSTSEATAINASPNFLKTIGSDAAQSSVPAPKPPAAKPPAPKPPAPPPGYGGGKTAGQVARNR